MKPNMKVVYQSESLDAIIRYFKRGYNCQEPGWGVFSIDVEAVDMVRGKVVFKITLEEHPTVNQTIEAAND